MEGEKMPAKQTIDLRALTRDKFLALGKQVSYGWKPKGSGLKPWPTIKLSSDCILVSMSGTTIEADLGDYIVLINENPLEFGFVAYFAHETQWNVEPVPL